MTSKNIFSEIVKDLSTYSERDILILARKWSIPFVNKSQAVNVIAYKIFSDNFSNNVIKIGKMDGINPNKQKKRTALPDRSSSSSSSSSSRGYGGSSSSSSRDYGGSSSSRDVYNDEEKYPREEVKEVSLGDDLERLVGRDPARHILSKLLKDPKDLLNAIKRGDIEWVNYFLSMGMEVQPQKYFDAAIETGNIEMVKLIMSRRENFSRDLNNGLESASQGGYMEIVLLMINSGARDWNRALRGASRGGHMDIVKLMIQKGADDWNSSLWDASRGGHMDIVNYLENKISEREI